MQTPKRRTPRLKLASAGWNFTMSSAAQLEMRRFNLNSIQIDNWPALSGPFYLCLRLAPALRPLCALNLPAGSVGRGAGFEPPSSRPDPFGSGFGSRCSLAGIRGPRWASRDPPAVVRGPRWMSSVRVCRAVLIAQGPPAIGSNCAVSAPKSAIFAPRPRGEPAGAWAMFLTNNHVENNIDLG